ncbi:MAG: apolipoprotein N-acyltransferase [Acidimicrobiia bacterium]|nr:apolipoprotein N-acyltransferase [Acidimicrobiia bacterium]
MWIPYVTAAASGLLLVLAFPPFDFGVLAFVAPVPLLWGLRHTERPGTALAAGFVFGAIFFGILLRWILVIGAVAWVPLTLYLASTAAAYAFLVWFVRLWPAWRWWLVVIGGWALWEFLRARFPFGGFPWGGLGYAAAGNPGALGATQWVGPTGWTVLAVAVAAGVVLVIEDHRHWRHAVDSLAVVLLLVLCGALFAPSADGDEVRVAVVQGNSPCPMTRCQNENKRIYESHMALTQRLVEGTVDLVVWAENSTGSPYEPEGNPDVAEAIASEAQRLGAYVMVSGTRSAGPGEFANVNMLWSPSGLKVGEYFKQHPVPFGEYVPFRSALDFIPQLERVPRDMVRGDETVVFSMVGGDLGSLISFEGAFIRHLRASVREGAELLVVATNESSYGEGPAADQFIDMTRVGAAAMGMDLVHAAITGKSTIIAADGTYGDTTDLLSTEVLFGRAAFRDAGSTLYARFGDVLSTLAIVIALALLASPIADRIRRRGIDHPDQGLTT